MTDGAELGRRQFLAAAVASAALAAGGAAIAQLAPSPKSATARRLIDVHRHIQAPRLRRLLNSQGMFDQLFANDSVEKMLADMDQAGVSTSIITLMATPERFTFVGNDHVEVARDANLTMAQMRTDYPARFGFFASLPLPEVDASLKELAYALDTLKADGVQFHTSYRNRWLGDPAFEPVYQELNRRKAVVYTHPVEAACCSPAESGVPASVIEYGADTARTIAQWIFSGAAARYPDIQVIFSHAGGVMTGIMERFVLLAQLPEMVEKVPGGAEAAVRRCYYDTAQAFSAATLKGLNTVVPATQILFGTDYPYRSASLTWDSVVASGAYSGAELPMVGGGNARRLLGRA